jgi:cytochrome c-type biogenesis protein
MQNRAGLVSAPLLGFLFGLGWTPCIGPTLAAVETLAFQEANALRGAVLSLAYCFGLGVPFILFGLLFERSKKVRSFLTKRGNVITVIGGVLLIVMGIAQVLGLWNEAMAWLRTLIADFAPVI